MRRFLSVSRDRGEIVDEIKLTSCKWSLNRLKGPTWLFYEWSWDPGDCLNRQRCFGVEVVLLSLECSACRSVFFWSARLLFLLEIYTGRCFCSVQNNIIDSP